VIRTIRKKETYLDIANVMLLEKIDGQEAIRLPSGVCQPAVV
jgi:hypothetical protein